MSLASVLPWTKAPLIVSAPMRLISLAPLAVAVSRAGGLGFIGAGNDAAKLESHLQEAQRLIRENPIPKAPADILPVGVGFVNWESDLSKSANLISKYRPAAVWLFAARSDEEMLAWTTEIRKQNKDTKIWIQVGSVALATNFTKTCKPDVLVVQGSDAGGHALLHGDASLVTLVPEIADAVRDLGDARPHIVASGGIVDGRGVVAAQALGADGVAMGTRFLVTPESNISQGYRQAILDGNDGGQSTVRAGVYNILRGTHGWPEEYKARGLWNQSWVDWQNGMPEEENKRLYAEALKKGDDGWGVQGRLATYAGTGVGLLKTVKPAGEVVKDVLKEVEEISGRLRSSHL